MDLKPLWTFYNVAKHKSFSLTAEKLFVTQPLVSTRVKQLEDRYKVKLIERSRRKIKLTDDGEILFSYAEKIFNLVKEADNHMEDVKKLNYGHLKISAGLTLGTYFLPPLLAAFRKKYPHIEIHMKVRNKQEVIGDILSQTDDFGFIGYMEPDGKLELTPLWEEELVLVVPPFHPFTRLKSVSLADLNDQSLIFRERGSGTREWVEKILQQEGVSVRGVMELGSHEAIKRAVEVGLGISFLPICAIGRKQDPPLLRVIPLRQKIYLNYYMIYGKNQYLSHSMRAFLKMVLELSHPSRKPVLDKGAFPPYNLST